MLIIMPQGLNTPPTRMYSTLIVHVIYTSTKLRNCRPAGYTHTKIIYNNILVIHNVHTYTCKCANTTKPSTYTQIAAAGFVHPGTPAALRRFLPPSQSHHTDSEDLPLDSFSFHAITSEKHCQFLLSSSHNWVNILFMLG